MSLVPLRARALVRDLARYEVPTEYNPNVGYGKNHVIHVLDARGRGFAILVDPIGFRVRNIAGAVGRYVNHEAAIGEVLHARRA